MTRPIRKKLKFDEESMNSLLEEIYNDSHNIKGKITRLFTKWELKVKENGDIMALGDQLVKLIGAESKISDQKIMLLKYLKDGVSESKTGVKVSDESSEVVSNDRRQELIKMVRDEADKRAENKN